MDVKFDPSKIQVTNPTTGKSLIKVWISQPIYSNTKGEISFIGGMPSPGINTSAGLISTVTFRAISPGRTEISFLSSSKVLRNDPEATQILAYKGEGVYDILIPPPEGPKVFSPTHPNSDKWYKNTNPTFSWHKEQGVTDFSYTLTKSPTDIPDNKSEGDHTSISYSDLKDGIWYFHIKARKASTWGGTTHYPIKIDSTPPAFFIPEISPSKITIQNQLLVSFLTTDALSGISHYQLKCINITPGRNQNESGFFVEAASPYGLPSLEVGDYLVVVRAYDKAGNFREGVTKIRILPKSLLITKKGIQYRVIFLYWWEAILIVTAIIVLILLYFQRRYRNLVRNKRTHLNRVKMNLKKIEERKRKEIPK